MERSPSAAVFLVLYMCIATGASQLQPKFSKTPTWPHSNYYDEDGPPILLDCPLVSYDGVKLLWFKDEQRLNSVPNLEHKRQNHELFSLNPIQHIPVNEIIIGSSLGVVAVLVGVVAFVVLRHKKKQQEYDEMDWPDPDIKYDERKIEYDVFISYSSDDLKWTKDVLFSKLDAMGYNRKDVLIVIKYDQSKVPLKLTGKTFLDWNDNKVKPHFWARLFDAIGKPGDLQSDVELNNRHRLSSDDFDTTNTDDEDAKLIINV
ncbi:hypothetical protein MAR_035376 [Mya arenaria]|uniref:TIR domain-containing protein n=1 Tax=Mya arenaria TaxID=6604 RepID=A0ABY7EM56_MYAAR|nr:hypothetical protein MAR_035376 [Mya arenaria]